MPQTEPGENLNLVEESIAERADRLHRSSRFDAGSGYSPGAVGMAVGASEAGAKPGAQELLTGSSLAVDGSNRPEVKLSTVAGVGYAPA